MSKTENRVEEKNGKTRLGKILTGSALVMAAAPSYALDTTGVVSTINDAVLSIDTTGLAILSAVVAIVVIAWIASTLKRA